MGLNVDTPSLRTVASELDEAGQALAQAADDVGALDEVSHPDVGGGLAALTVAWGAALEILSEDASFLSTRVADAATVYDTTDEALAGGIRGPR